MLKKQLNERTVQFGIIILLPLLILFGSLAAVNWAGIDPARAAALENEIVELQSFGLPHQQICECSEDVYDCEYFVSQEVAQACFDYCQSTTQNRDIHQLDPGETGVACEGVPYGVEPTPTPAVGEPPPVQEELPPGSNNLVFNGNFEFGFYNVPGLGFELNDFDNDRRVWVQAKAPNDWNWFKNEKFGKYSFYNNEGFGVICADDTDQKTTAGKNSFTIDMASTDQSDARLGIYQTVSVVPGQEYMFSISGTIEVQPGGSSPDINHRTLLYFDQKGGTDWRAIPHEDWTTIPWREQELEFRRSGPDDPDIAEIEDYYQVVRAESDKLTVFLMAWRRWANWRTGRFTFDCVSLVPLGTVNVAGVVPRLSEISVTTVDDALEAGSTAPPGSASSAVEPAAVPATGQEKNDDTAVPAVVPADGAESDESAPPASEFLIIPPSGGVIESSGNALLIGVVSIFLIFGLVGAGIWNARRQK
jgi:hypothetical protein